MFRTILWFIKFWLYQIYAFKFWLIISKMEKKGYIKESEAFLHENIMVWAKAMVENTGSMIKLTGAENIPAEGAVLFASNHQANFDIPILLGYLNKPKGFVAKVELEKLPLVNRWMKKMRCVFLDRKDTRKSMKAINEAIEIMKSGHSMIIFPEGTRSKSSRIGEFKKGSLKMAIKANVPVVPVTINGSYKIMGAKGIIITPSEVEVIVGRPVYPDTLKDEQKHDFAQYIKKKIVDNLVNDHAG